MFALRTLQSPSVFRVFPHPAKAAIERSGTKVEEAFVAVLAPGWLDHFIFNEYHKTEEEFLFALADALREEYRAVVTAGFVLQIDDPGLPDWWDMLKPEPTIEAYRKFARLRRCRQPRASRHSRREGAQHSALRHNRRS